MAEYRRSGYLANLFHHLKPGFLRGQNRPRMRTKRTVTSAFRIILVIRIVTISLW